MSARAQRESARRVSDCVTALLNDQPFFGSLALRLPIRTDATRSTLASDGREIRYSPAWVAENRPPTSSRPPSPASCSPAPSSTTRGAGDRDGERWQHASQLVTHGLLRDAGFRLPPRRRGLGRTQRRAGLRPPAPARGRRGPAPLRPRRPASAAGRTGTRARGGRRLRSVRRRGAAATNRARPAPPRTTLPCSPAGQSAGDPDGPASDAPDVFCRRCRPGPAELRPCRHRRGHGLERRRYGRRRATPRTPRAIDRQEQDWDEAMHQALSLAKAQGKVPGAVQETVEAAHVQHLRLAHAAPALHDRRPPPATTAGASPTAASSTPASTFPRSARKAWVPLP